MYWSDFWKFDFLGQKYVVVAEKWPKRPKMTKFQQLQHIFDPKNQNFENLICTYFLITFPYNLAKFQVWRTSKSPEIAQNVK